ncbi:MAG: hypothetical protein KBT12_04020 [Bacteroidales bacterium]|nr:hypothetical protein [Candidatus Physcousia equi]
MKKTYTTPLVKQSAPQTAGPTLISLSEYADDSDAKVREEGWTDTWSNSEPNPTPYALRDSAEQ